MSDSLPPMTDETLAAIEAQWADYRALQVERTSFGAEMVPVDVDLLDHKLAQVFAEVKRLNREFADFRQMAVLNSKTATEAVDRARSECAALAAKVERLRAERDRAINECDGWETKYAELSVERDALRRALAAPGMPHTPAQGTAWSDADRVCAFDGCGESCRHDEENPVPPVQGPLERPETDGYCDDCGVPTTTIGDQPWHTGHRKYDEYWSDCRDTLRPPRGIKTYTEALVSQMIPADLVTVDPEVQGGDPCMKGTRVQAYLVATLLEDGATWEQVKETYPSIPTPEGLREAPQEAQERPGTREGDTGTGTGVQGLHRRTEAALATIRERAEADYVTDPDTVTSDLAKDLMQARIDRQALLDLIDRAEEGS